MRMDSKCFRCGRTTKYRHYRRRLSFSSICIYMFLKKTIIFPQSDKKKTLGESHRERERELADNQGTAEREPQRDEDR